MRILAALAFSALIFAGAAQAGPFSCTGDVYQVQSGQLKIFNPLTSTYVPVGTVQTSYNAAGFNTIDSYAYAMQGNNVIRVNADGSVNILYNIGSSSNAGAVDNANSLYIKNTTTSLKKIDLATGIVTNITLTGSGLNAADFAWAQVGATRYLIGSESNGAISVVNLNTNVVTQVAVSGLPSGSTYGASWRDVTGRVFTFNTTRASFTRSRIISPPRPPPCRWLPDFQAV